MSSLLAQRNPLLEDFQGMEKNEARDTEDYDYSSRWSTIMARIASKLLALLQTLPSLLQSILLSCLWSLIPSFIRRPDPSIKPSKLHPTAYLDGLRGVAAFFVFIHHFLHDWHPFLSNGYGCSLEDTYFAQLPFVRIIYSGRGMVTTFFVISGFVLSYKAIGLSHTGRYATLLDSLASSVFRRGMRLFIPTTVSTFISLILSRLDLFRHDPGRQNLIPTRQTTLSAEIGVWLKNNIAIADPFQMVGGKSPLFGHPYDGHLWTIPIEYHGSFVVFVTVLCLAKVRPNVRLIVLLSLVAYTLHQAHWEMSLFLCGILFADIGFFSSARDDRPPNTPSDILDILSSSLPRLSPRVRLILRRIGIFGTFVLALYLLCYPDFRAEQTSGYSFIINHLTPQSYHTLGKVQKFSVTLGAMLLVLSIIHSPTLQRPFITPFAQYLGKISYALYMVHGPVLYTGGMMMLLAAKSDLDAVKETSADLPEDMAKQMLTVADQEYMRRFVVAAVSNLVVSIWAADWLWRVVDTRAVMFARKVGEWCWVSE